tara:strand:- start:211 stop:393 length:183 start_codon:yes stop_codon:yes gene_type:complete
MEGRFVPTVLVVRFLIGVPVDPSFECVSKKGIFTTFWKDGHMVCSCIDQFSTVQAWEIGG